MVSSRVQSWEEQRLTLWPFAGVAPGADDASDGFNGWFGVRHRDRAEASFEHRMLMSRGTAQPLFVWVRKVDGGGMEFPSPPVVKVMNATFFFSAPSSLDLGWRVRRARSRSWYDLQGPGLLIDCLCGNSRRVFSPSVACSSTTPFVTYGTDTSGSLPADGLDATSHTYFTL